MSLRKFALAAALAAFGFAGVAVAQNTTPTLPLVSPLNTGDYVQVIPGGQPYVGNKYAPAGAVAGVPSYVNLGVTTSGNTYTYTNSQVWMLMQPAATLAAVTLVTAPNPGDGQRECFVSTQTTTTLTWNANTGQSISNAPTAGVANTAICLIYVAGTSTWYRA